MAEETGEAIIPGSYNDAKIKVKGGDICVGQNPVMFIVLAVIALIIAAVLFFLGGKGEMTISGIPIPAAAAKVICVAIATVFLLAAVVCVLQSLSPAMLVLSPEQGTYKRTGGIVGKIAMRPVQSGSIEDFEKLTLTHGSGQNPSGQHCEWWRLTLHWKSGGDFNLGSFSEQARAKQLANGFAEKLKLSLEER
ncbi:MAG: hypothetical protein AB1696_23850 [Planctomycetota bacterium]